MLVTERLTSRISLLLMTVEFDFDELNQVQFEKYALGQYPHKKHSMIIHRVKFEE